MDYFASRCDCLRILLGHQRLPLMTSFRHTYLIFQISDCTCKLPPNELQVLCNCFFKINESSTTSIITAAFSLENISFQFSCAKSSKFRLSTSRISEVYNLLFQTFGIFRTSILIQILFMALFIQFRSFQQPHIYSAP